MVDQQVYIWLQGYEGKLVTDRDGFAWRVRINLSERVQTEDQKLVVDVQVKLVAEDAKEALVTTGCLAHDQDQRLLALVGSEPLRLEIAHKQQTCPDMAAAKDCLASQMAILLERVQDPRVTAYKKSQVEQLVDRKLAFQLHYEDRPRYPG